MALDATDTRMIKGLLLFLGLALLLYYYPFSWPITGIQEQERKQEELVKALNEKSKDYRDHFGMMDPRALGVAEDAPPALPGGREVELLKKDYEEAIEKIRKQIEEKQALSRMNFEAWTNVPPGWERDPGTYFGRMYTDLRNRLETDARVANVDVVDRDIGFKKFDGKADMKKEEAQELLRKLFIAETVIRLCMQARTEQEAYKRKLGKKPDAFMRVISVAPEDSISTGPYLRVKNLKYDPAVTDPRSDKFRYYNIKPLPAFIQEYPVEIRLECDADSFMRFLYSVRSKGRFLVIRNLSIVSPYMDESLKDKTDFVRVSGLQEHKDLNDEHIWLRISAAGMDFFDPEKGGPTAGKGAAKTQRRPTRPSGPAGH